MTIIREVMCEGEQALVCGSLEEITSPFDDYGSSSAGIYVWWSVETREVLYVGLAVDLPRRVGQHVGLAQYAPAGCKRAEIRAWLDEYGEVGLSVIVQSSNDQPVCARLAQGLGTTCRQPRQMRMGATGPVRMVSGRACSPGCRDDLHSAVTSVTAARAADSSTMALLSA